MPSTVRDICLDFFVCVFDLFMIVSCDFCLRNARRTYQSFMIIYFKTNVDSVDGFMISRYEMF